MPLLTDFSAFTPGPDANAAQAPRRPSVRFMLSHPAHLIALGFGAGLSPFAPGTAGTLWAWLAFIVIAPWMNAVQMGCLIGLSSLLGWLSPGTGAWVDTSLLGLDLTAFAGVLALGWMARATSRRVRCGPADSVWSISNHRSLRQEAKTEVA